MTGTKDFNRKSMLKYENMVDKEVEKEATSYMK